MAYRLTSASKAITAIRLSISHLHLARSISTTVPHLQIASPASTAASATASTSRSLRPTPRILSREELHRLHRLSALNPPPPDSPEERKLLHDLGALVGLMDMVKDVELPAMTDEEIGRLLAGGVGSVEFDGLDGEEWDGSMEGAGGKGMEEEKACIGGTATHTREESMSERKKGRELLEYATNRQGDYYMSRKASLPADS